jgi:hypothetical protein
LTTAVTPAAACCFECSSKQPASWAGRAPRAIVAERGQDVGAEAVDEGRREVGVELLAPDALHALVRA